jgi:hypothetical protein
MKGKSDMREKKVHVVKKYTDKELVKLRVKLNGGDWSESWIRKHFRQLIDYAEWQNGLPGGFRK